MKHYKKPIEVFLVILIIFIIIELKYSWLKCFKFMLDIMDSSILLSLVSLVLSIKVLSINIKNDH